VSGDAAKIASFRLEVLPPEQPDFPFKIPVEATARQYLLSSMTLRAGLTYKWQVVAILTDKTEIKPASPASFTTATFFTPLKNLGFSLIKQFPDLDSGGTEGGGGGKQDAAAAFTFSHSNTQDTWDIDGVLIWRSKTSFTLGDLNLQPTASFEAHVADDPKNNQDALRLRTGLHIFRSFGNEPAVTGLWGDINLKYATNRENNVQQLSVEPLLSVNASTWAIGQAQPLLHDRPDVPGQPDFQDVRWDVQHGIWLAWRPYIGFDGGHTLDDRHKATDGSDFFRLLGVVKGQLIFPDVARELHLQKVDAFAENDFAYSIHPDGNRDYFHDFLDVGVEFFIDKNLNISLEYKEGETSPSFKNTHSIGVSLGLQI
jgi:hypothetical protein